MRAAHLLLALVSYGYLRCTLPIPRSGSLGAHWQAPTV
jgi:hypothetical protein